MTNFTKHFKIKEFNCKDGTPVPPQYLSNAKKVADQLEVLRAALGGRPIIITSGYRTPEHNKKVGGVGGSAHLTASAADIVVRGIPQLCTLRYSWYPRTVEWYKKKRR